MSIIIYKFYFSVKTRVGRDTFLLQSDEKVVRLSENYHSCHSELSEESFLKLSPRDSSSQIPQNDTFFDIFGQPVGVRVKT